MLTVTKLTPAVIRISSTKAFGLDKIIMWEGNPYSIGYTDDADLDESRLTILNAQKYQYVDSDIIYSEGKATPIKGLCPNLKNDNDQCFCTGECMIDVADDLSVDPNYFKQLD